MVYFNRSVEERKRKKPSVRTGRTRSVRVLPAERSSTASGPSVASAEYLILHTGDVIRLPATKPVTPQRSDAFTRQNKPAAEAADAAAEAADATEAATRLRLIRPQTRNFYSQINTNCVI